MARLSKIIALLTLACTMAMGMPARSNAAVFVGLTVSFGPPALPYYDQPPAPAPNLIWQPGYWAWGPYGYYWVPGHVGRRTATRHVLDARILGVR